MNREYESTENFSNMLEYINSCQHSSSESINELDKTIEESVMEPDFEPDSRSNSIMSDDIDYFTITQKIPIPIKTPRREREVQFNGMFTFDLHELTPTPTKYSNMINENVRHIDSLIQKYYQEVEYNLSPYNK
jgi:hypothetical protein